jgi:tetratricopeptide (TPR) repeat protein
VENQLDLARSGLGEKQVILGRGGLAAARLPHFEKVARAESLLAENRFPEAGVEIEPVLPLLKRSSRGLRVWAQVLAALNRVEESIDVCEQVLRLDPRDATASELLATLRNRASTTSTGGSSVEVPPGVCQQEKGARL